MWCDVMYSLRNSIRNKELEMIGGVDGPYSVTELL
jgi:hypothetical protein